MSRQLSSYMVPEPLEPLSLEEVKFWLRIMQEHALFIKSGLPCDQVDLIDEAQAFYQEFDSLRVRAERLQNDKKFMELVNDTQVTVKEFYVFKRDLVHRMLECKLGGYNFPLFLDHVAREAEYFLRLLDKIKNGKVPLTGGTKAQENVFWLRIMADHTKFICHLLDPSERNLIQTANSFSEEFDDLFLQGRDFSSMLQGYPEVASFRRFLQDVRAAVMRLRDFKRAAQDMIEECKLVGLIPALLADHVRREAEHFLLILTMMEKGIMKNTQVASQEDIGDIPLMSTVQNMSDSCEFPTALATERDEEVPPENEKLQIDPVEKEKVSEHKLDGIPKYSSLGNKAKFIATKEMVEEESIVEEKEKMTPSSHKIESKNVDAKYKWSGKWPRQLGKKD